MAEDVALAVDTQRRQRLCWLLVLIAPLVAEFVSGNLPLTFVWLLLVYAPLYGAAALLIREAGRRSRRPWPVIVLLGLAYGLAEEAFLSGSLFNPTYAGFRLLDFGWIPAAGIGAWWTAFVIVLHLVWSICVPIVLAESVGGDLAGRPWLGRGGLVGAGCALVVGAAAVAGISLAEEGATSSPAQLGVALVVVLALVLAAVRVCSRPAAARGVEGVGGAGGLPPRPRTVLGCAAIAGILFMAGAAQQGPVALTLGGYAVLFVASALLVARWSRRPGWGATHRLALATGALVPHVAFALLQQPLVDVPTGVAVAGDVVFTGILVAFLAIAWRQVGSTPRVGP